MLATPPAQCANPYESVAGDYWLRIAEAAEIDLDELLELNDATADTPLYPGSVVCLPAGACGPTDDRRTVDAAADGRAGDHGCRHPGDHRAADDGAGDHGATTEHPATTEAPTTVPPAPPAPAEIEQIIRDVWPDDLEEQALRIAWRESSYNPRAQNFCCSGLFQIYYDVHAGWLADSASTRSRTSTTRTPTPPRRTPCTSVPAAGVRGR